jgi:hypothetical protein
MKKWLMLAPALGLLAGCGGGPTVPTAPANIAGSYNVYVTASITCSANLPAESRTLEFLANIAQSDVIVQVQLIAKVPGVPEVSFPAAVSGQTVSFSNFSFTEPMGRGAALVASGNAGVAPNGLSMTGTLSGTYQASSGASCNATTHQLQFIKLCSQATPSGTALLPCQQ